MVEARAAAFDNAFPKCLWARATATVQSDLSFTEDGDEYNIDGNYAKTHVVFTSLSDSSRSLNRIRSVSRAWIAAHWKRLNPFAVNQMSSPIRFPGWLLGVSPAR